MKHFYFDIFCEDGFKAECDLVRESQQEAEEQLHRINEIGFTSVENGKMVWHKMESFQLVKVTDPHDDVSPQMWKTENIPFTTLEDMLERQKQYCLKRKDDPESVWNKPEKFTLHTSYEYWELYMLDAVREAWGLETPETLERKRLREEFERQYSVKYMTQNKFRVRRGWATKYSKMWNDWLEGKGHLGQYDKWTFQQMLESRGYGSYNDKNGKLVVLPCFDCDTPPLDENGDEI